MSGGTDNPRDIPVVILAGGMGTRLREVTERVPKPLVEVGEQPILWHIMKLYAHYGFRRFILCLGYKSWDVKQYFLTYREQLSDFTLRLSDEHRPQFHRAASYDHDWEITFAETGLRTGTGGRLSRVRRYIDSDTFMFTYGDGLGDVDLATLLQFHRRHDRIGTVTAVHPTSRFGEMHTSDDNVVEFNEKPTRPEGYVSGGFFVFDRGIFDYVTDDEGLFFEAEPLQKLARDGQLKMFQHEGFWVGMDTYRDWQLLHELWLAGQAPWQIWEE